MTKQSELPEIHVPDPSELPEQWQQVVVRLVERAEALESDAASCHKQAVAIVSALENVLILAEKAFIENRVHDAQKYVESACHQIRERRSGGVSGALN